MKLLKTTITPMSSFATSLKGDTLWGQICWAIRYRYGEARLESLLENYDKEPFLIASDGFLSGFLPKPCLPLSVFGKNIDKKAIRKKIWLKADDFAKGKFQNALADDEIESKIKQNATIKNSINYATFTTDADEFAPFALIETALPPLDIYFLIDENAFSQEELKAVMHDIGECGYGKKASIGKGRFKINKFENLNTPASKIFMALSPFVLQGSDLAIKKCFYEPFTRFGKHGGDLALSSDVTKKPVLMAQTSALIALEDESNIQFIGKSIRGASTHKKSVQQGYAILMPTKWSGNELCKTL